MVGMARIMQSEGRVALVAISGGKQLEHSQMPLDAVLNLRVVGGESS
jgi:hypothetical protein